MISGPVSPVERAALCHHLKLTPPTRQRMLELGAEKFNVLAKKKIPCISGFIKSYQLLKHNFPTDIELRDNRWQYKSTVFRLPCWIVSELQNACKFFRLEIFIQWLAQQNFLVL